MNLLKSIQRKKKIVSRKQTERKFLAEQLEDRRLLAASVGWDGPGQGSADLTYYIRNTPTGLSMQQVTSAIKTALNAWSSVVDVDFTPASRAGLQRSIDISFQRIDGSGSTLAYAYMPATSSRASSLAGDVVFDSSERWEIGNGQGNRAFDLVSVAVHEIGHALGLDHLTNQASIMFASISASDSFKSLEQVDVVAIRQIYASRTVTATAISPEGSSNTSAGTSTTTSSPGTTTNTPTTKPIDTRWLTMPLSLLSTVSTSQVSEVFDKLDADDSGEISTSEISNRLRNLLLEKGFDADSSGGISAEEFSAGVQILQRKLFDRIDADQDGQLSSTEVNSTVWETLGRADSDSNGGVSFAEFLSFQQKTMFERYDGNSDGEISQDEVSENIWSRLSRKDRDASGTVSAIEFQQRMRRGGFGQSELGQRGREGNCESSVVPTINTDPLISTAVSTSRTNVASSISSAITTILSRGIRRR